MAANTKRKVATVSPEWPRLQHLRAVVQDGISPSDTVLRLQCRACPDHVEEMPASKALAPVKDELSNTLNPEARRWIEAMEKKHRRCGKSKGTRGVTQRLF